MKINLKKKETETKPYQGEAVLLIWRKVLLGKVEQVFQSYNLNSVM